MELLYSSSVIVDKPYFFISTNCKCLHMFVNLMEFVLQFVLISEKKSIGNSLCKYNLVSSGDKRV